jgi:hypothetical protein
MVFSFVRASESRVQRFSRQAKAKTGESESPPRYRVINNDSGQMKSILAVHRHPAVSEKTRVDLSPDFLLDLPTANYYLLFFVSLLTSEF